MLCRIRLCLRGSCLSRRRSFHLCQHRRQPISEHVVCKAAAASRGYMTTAFELQLQRQPFCCSVRNVQVCMYDLSTCRSAPFFPPPKSATLCRLCLVFVLAEPLPLYNSNTAQYTVLPTRVELTSGSKNRPTSRKKKHSSHCLLSLSFLRSCFACVCLVSD